MPSSCSVLPPARCQTRPASALRLSCDAPPGQPRFTRSRAPGWQASAAADPSGVAAPAGCSLATAWRVRQTVPPPRPSHPPSKPPCLQATLSLSRRASQTPCLPDTLPPSHRASQPPSLPATVPESRNAAAAHGPLRTFRSLPEPSMPSRIPSASGYTVEDEWPDPRVGLIRPAREACGKPPHSRRASGWRVAAAVGEGATSRHGGAGVSPRTSSSLRRRPSARGEPPQSRGCTARSSPDRGFPLGLITEETLGAHRISCILRKLTCSDGMGRLQGEISRPRWSEIYRDCGFNRGLNGAESLRGMRPSHIGTIEEATDRGSLNSRT